MTSLFFDQNNFRMQKYEYFPILQITFFCVTITRISDIGYHCFIDNTKDFNNLALGCMSL